MDRKLSKKANNRYSYLALVAVLALICLWMGLFYSEMEKETADRYPASQARADQMMLMLEHERDITEALQRHELLKGHPDMVSRLDALEERVSALESGE